MRIFFSHSSRDKALLRELREHFPPWLTSWLDEDRLVFGASLANSLRDAINSEVDYVVVFLGHEAVNSEWVKKEIEWALENEKTLNRTFLLPVVLADVRQHLDSLGLGDRITLDGADQSKEAVRGLAAKIVNHLATWMATRLNALQEPPNAFKAKATLSRLPQYDQIVSSIAGGFSSIPPEWRSDVEAQVLKPLLLTLQKLRGGKIPLDPGQYFQCILREIEHAKEGWTISAVSTLSSDLWSDNVNQKNYARRNVEALKRGARIQRLFVLPVGTSEDYSRILQEQIDSGVKVRVADTRLLAQTRALDDLVIFQSSDLIHAYVCYPAIDDPRRIRSGRMVIDSSRCYDYLDSFSEGWNSALDLDDYLRASELQGDAKLSANPPGLALPVQQLTSPVVTCAEAAAARGVNLSKELKTLVLETSSGLVAVHLPGDALLSLRAVKDFLEAEEAYVADPETLLRIGLSPGTVSAILEPVWSMPHLISRRVFDADLVTTNNKTRTGYFSFDPVILTQAKNVKVGEFEKPGKHPNS